MLNITLLVAKLQAGASCCSRYLGSCRLWGGADCIAHLAPERVLQPPYVAAESDAKGGWDKAAAAPSRLPANHCSPGVPLAGLFSAAYQGLQLPELEPSTQGGGCR